MLPKIFSWARRLLVLHYKRILDRLWTIVVIVGNGFHVWLALRAPLHGAASANLIAKLKGLLDITGNEAVTLGDLASPIGDILGLFAHDYFVGFTNDPIQVVFLILGVREIYRLFWK